jgi:hypothetical protein
MQSKNKMATNNNNNNNNNSNNRIKNTLLQTD